jgi:hypothetical protein
MLSDVAKVRLDLNNPAFQDHFYRGPTLKWEVITSLKPPERIDSLIQCGSAGNAAATAHRGGGFIRLLTIVPDHN